MDPAIRIENLSKQYRLGTVGTGTLSHDLKRWWHLARGKEDPYLKIGETNDRSKKGTSELVWALKDINFEVQQGEILGIIGKNGAGKSTLLKILSKVTGPTTGTITYKGRIGSLLEVGTGFHQELTGRENIYLNGAILGMRKHEITRKFDEIVDFSGCERYIDTPVKRYSSGMTVRLGFAVAAFLEPEILVVDEVLAVGDAEFQKKAIGKMQDVSRNDGRTVLFVSHNMGAVKNLCRESIILENGALVLYGETYSIVDKYIRGNQVVKVTTFSKNIVISKLEFTPEIILSNQQIGFQLELISSWDDKIKSVGLLFYDQYDQRIAIIDLRREDYYQIKASQILRLEGVIEQLPLVEGTYKIGVFFGGQYVSRNFYDIINLNVINENQGVINYPSEVRGYIHLNCKFTHEIV